MSFTSNAKILLCLIHNNFLYTCFDQLSYFLLKDGTKGLITRSKIHVCHNYNFLKSCFEYFS